MNKYVAVLIGSFIVVVSVISCKKSTSSTVQQNDLTGNWRITRIAVDSNGNGIIDNNELMAPTSYDSTHIYAFGSDGSGQVIYLDSGAGTFAWAFENSNTYLRLYFPGSVTGLSVQHIDTLSAEVMTLRDTSVNPIVWNLYTKQH